MEQTIDPLARAAEWCADGLAVAVATVVETWGSAPCRAGSKLVIDERGRFEGSVSGGCVEAAVIERAQAVIATGTPALLTFGVSDPEAWAVGLACGGQIRVFVERIEPAALAALREAGRPVVRITSLADGAWRLVRFDAPTDVDPRWKDAARAAIASDRAATVERDGIEWLVEPFNPPLRMLIVGAVHVAQPLSRMASIAGFEVVVIDPRGRFATPARFSEATLRVGWPADEVAALLPDGRTAVIALSHDPKIDDPALAVALRSEAFYVGALGSRRTHATRLRRLEAVGFDSDALERIHGPVGLPIGARTPAEIATSILAEVVFSLRSSAASRDTLPSAAKTGVISDGWR